MTRIDKSILPIFIIKMFENYDEPNKSYMATVFLFHQHNHPIAITWSRLMQKHLEHIYFL